MTKLDAVNFVLTQVGMLSITTLETNSASTAGIIEREIDRRVKMICEEGWYFNRRQNVSLTPDLNGHILLGTIGDLVLGGYITAITASTTPVVTSNAHNVLANALVMFSSTDCAPALTDNSGQPYTVASVTTDTFTLTSGQVTTTSPGTTGFYAALNPGVLLTIGGAKQTVDFNRSIHHHQDRLYDLDQNSDVFNGTIQVDYTFQPSFDFLPPLVQTYAAAEAAFHFNKGYGQPPRAPELLRDALRAKVRARNADSRVPQANILGTADVQDVRGWRVPFPGGPFTGQAARSM